MEQYTWIRRHIIGHIIGLVGAVVCGYGATYDHPYLAVLGGFIWALGFQSMGYALALRDHNDGRIK